MVESVNSSAARAQLQKVSPAKPDANGKVGSVGSAATVVAADSVSLSQAAQLVPTSMNAEPPFDIEAVTRIREAIAEGKYPIDVERITDSLFEGYQELML